MRRQCAVALPRPVRPVAGIRAQRPVAFHAADPRHRRPRPGARRARERRRRRRSRCALREEPPGAGRRHGGDGFRVPRRPVAPSTHHRDVLDAGECELPLRRVLRLPGGQGIPDLPGQAHGGRLVSCRLHRSTGRTRDHRRARRHPRDPRRDGCRRRRTLAQGAPDVRVYRHEQPCRGDCATAPGVGAVAQRGSTRSSRAASTPRRPPQRRLPPSSALDGSPCRRSPGR